MSPSNKGQKLPGEILSQPEVTLLLEACGRHKTGLRNRAAIILMVRAGLRCAEALSVRRCDFTVDDGKAVVRILQPKGAGGGKQPRVVGLRADATQVIQDWLDVRDAPATTALCCSRNGRRVLTTYMRALLPRLARKAGIDHRVHPHALRHTWAHTASMGGMPMPVISRALGHTSLTVTATYLAHIAPLDVVSAMQE